MSLAQFGITGNRIMFYRANGEYGFLSNLYPAKLVFDNIEFKTSEHAYQYAKFRIDKEEDKKIRDWAMNAPTPSLMAQIAHSLFGWQINPNWSKIKIQRMRDVLRAKFDQNPELKEKLLSTKGKTLIEASKIDSFWGIGPKNRGKNMLGRLLMELRDDIYTGDE